MKFLLVLGVYLASAAATIDWDTILPEDNLEQLLTYPDKPVIESRISNGRIAQRKQFPYQVGLQVYLLKSTAWCGGTLISDEWILTVAHCVDSILSADVYLGTWDRTDRLEIGQRVIRVMRKDVIVHEHWNPSLVQNDIALIKLPYHIVFNEYIQPARLPKFSRSYSSYSGVNAIASGWGRISDSATTSTDRLRWIQVPVIRNSDCIIFFDGSVRDTNICIDTNEYKSTCNGDSGGPLVLADNSNTVIGLTSFRIKLGCEKGWPAVFTRVTSYLEWIAQNTGIVSI